MFTHAKRASNDAVAKLKALFGQYRGADSLKIVTQKS
jgi:hypothetical protein